VKVGDLVKYHPFRRHGRPSYRILLHVDSQFVRLSGQPQNQRVLRHSCEVVSEIQQDKY